MVNFKVKGNYSTEVEQEAWQRGFDAFESMFTDPGPGEVHQASHETIEQLISEYSDEIHEALMHGYGRALWKRFRGKA